VITRIYIGVDPSQITGATSGAIALSIYKGRQRICVYCIQFDEFPKVIVKNIKEVLAAYPKAEVYCLVERVWGRPDQSVKSTSKFMEGYGFIKGVLQALEINFVEVAPNVWQKDYGIEKDLTKSKHKTALKIKAQELFRSADLKGVKISLKNSDALLLSHYLCKNLTKLFTV
jgi:hypothetical protein